MSLGPLILNTSKIVMHEYWHDYKKPKYGTKETGSLTISVKSLEFYADLAGDVEERLNTSN